MNKSLLFELQAMLFECNHYVQQFKSLYTRIIHDHANIENVSITILDKHLQGEHPGRTNVPRVAEIAVLISGDLAHHRDIVIEGEL